MAQQNKNKGYLARAVQVEAKIFSELGREKESLEKIQISLKIFKENKDKNGIAKTNMIIGSKYFAAENYQKAVNIYKNSYEIFITLKDTIESINCLMNISRVYAVLRKKDSSFQTLKEAINLSEKNSNKSNLTQLYKYMSLLLLNEGYKKFDSSIPFFLKYPTSRLNYVKDSILSFKKITLKNIWIA